VKRVPERRAAITGALDSNFDATSAMPRFACVFRVTGAVAGGVMSCTTQRMSRS
jgi:hypothetical protein